MSLRRNTIWNLAGSGLPLIAAIFCIPFLINHLGNEAFGILTLVWALIGYFSLFDLGVGRALTYQISKTRSSATDITANTFIAGMLITLLAGLVGSIIVFIFAPSLVDTLEISHDFQIDAILTFQTCAIGIIPTTLTSGLRGTLEGLDRFAASNISKTIIGIGMFVLPVIAIKYGLNEIWEMTICIILLRSMICLALLLTLKDFFVIPSVSLLRLKISSLMNYSVWVWISGIVGPLMVYGDRFFVSAYIGTSSLPFYAIPQEGLQRLLMYPTAICGALLPKLS